MWLGPPPNRRKKDAVRAQLNPRKKGAANAPLNPRKKGAARARRNNKYTRKILVDGKLVRLVRPL